MKIETIRLKNFKCFKQLEIKNLPNLFVIVGANGTGKSTLFQVFEFLQEAMVGNVTSAIYTLGGSRGFQEVRSRDSEGAIEIEIQFRSKPDQPKVTYRLIINEDKGRVIVEREILKFRRRNRGQPWHFLDFSRGEGFAIEDEFDPKKELSELHREEQKLKSPDILAIKGLAQFQRFKAAVELGNLIEKWYISDFHINKARPLQQHRHAEHLSREGDNLSLVIDFLYKHYPDQFKTIVNKLKQRVPGISRVDPHITEEGNVLLKIWDSTFEEPFLARYVSDGTLRMLAYLTLLYDPHPHPLVCIEEPENQLYPKLLKELAEEFRAYAQRGSQVFVSTHSPDFVNALKPMEVFWFIKKNGYTQIKRASDDVTITANMEDGECLGELWQEGFLEGAHP